MASRLFGRTITESDNERKVGKVAVIAGGYQMGGLRFGEYAKQYGLTEHTTTNYVDRTEVNVRESDGTIRLATDFNSAGERCTLRFIELHKKPYFDVDMTGQHFAVFLLVAVLMEAVQPL